MTPVEITHGAGPIVLGLPHTGTFVPDEVHDILNETGRALADTDWHVDRLYEGLLPEASTVRATFHRYVIDANRAPSDESLYPGQNTTGLVPETDFDGRPIWIRPVTPDEVEARRLAYHTPYHAALKDALARARAAHGVAVLYDCHSIRSNISFLFEGTLPDMNIGTDGGQTCAPEIEALVQKHCADAPFSDVLNGRFRGGWTTRNYGQPGKGVHAIQMELAQSTYLADEMPPWAYDAAKAEKMRAVLRALLTDLADMAQRLGDDR